MKGRSCSLVFVFSLLNATFAFGEPDLNIYIDADFSNSAASSESIQRGIETALSTVGHQVQGRRINVLRADHRGNTHRSKRHIQKYLRDNQALLMFSGMHSPPMIANRDFINNNNVLYFVPWAAAGSITRPKTATNWIFRLSIDDTKAGRYLVEYVVNHGKYKNPLLLLENTSWGKFNRNTMAAELQRLDVAYDVQFFDWNIGNAEAAALVQAAKLRGNDVVLLVANAEEGAVLANALGGYEVPMVSHWGITGGNFPEKVKHPNREALSLRFLQTRFSFLRTPLEPHQKIVLERALKLWPEYEEAQDIVAPTGFIHAYDLTMILLAALQEVTLSDNMKDDRLAIHAALESLAEPIQGLLKTYDRPFIPYSTEQTDAHEALEFRDFAMGKYGAEGEIILIDWPPVPLQ